MASLNVLIAELARAMLPVQAAINAHLARAAGGPIWAAASSGSVLTLAIATVGADF